MNDYFQHHGIKGQKWGVRRFQNPDGSLTEAGKKREHRIAKRSQTLGYKDDYDRMEEYYKKSKVVQQRSKELASLAEKARNLSLKLDDYKESDKIYDEAEKRSESLAKKDPDYDKTGKNEKLNFNIMQYYLYEKDVLSKTADELLKNDKKYTELNKEYKNTIKAYKEKCSAITNDIVGDFGNEKIKGLGTDMNYRELTYYALSNPNTMWMFTWEEDMGRK